MNQPWHGLYIANPDATAVAAALGEALNTAGYTAYDPFPGGSGPSAFIWKRRAGHFVAPARDGWTLVLGEPDPLTLPVLASSLGTGVLQAWLTPEDAGLAAWSGEGPRDDPAACADWLRDGMTVDDLAHALAGQTPAPDLPGPEGPTVLAVPLPDDVRDLAEQVDPQQAEQMMQRITGSLFGRHGAGGAHSAVQAEAQQLLGGGGSLWNGAQGKRLRAALGCLAVPAAWALPTYSDVHAAMQVARARQHKPDGLRLPGDDAALAAVPDVLDYTPVYGGKRGA